MSTLRLINRKHVKEYALECAKERHHEFNRVSGDFLIYIDTMLRTKIREHVRALPSVGKTIR